MKNMVQKIIRGDQLAGARLIRMLEEGDPEGMEILKYLYPSTGNAYVMGITGPPGSGKSTLVNGIISEFRQSGIKLPWWPLILPALFQVVPCWAIGYGCDVIPKMPGFLSAPWPLEVI